MRRFLFCLLMLALASFAKSNQGEKPQSIASLNLCLDALLLKLVEPERINSLTYLSANSQFSPFADQAKKFHLNRGLAEDLVPRNPDLIVAGDFGAADAKSLLQQLGFRVETLSLPQTLSDISVHIRKLGELTASETKAEAMVQQLEEQIAKLDEVKQQHKPIAAFWYSSNGVVVGVHTLENELMTRAGFYNLALDKNINGFAQIDLEDLILAKPQVIIIEAADVPAFSLAQEYVQHPALSKNNIRILILPATLSVCIAPIATDVIANLIEQRQALSNLSNGNEK
jgi:iron complex transport system substrate-binding protein